VHYVIDILDLRAFRIDRTALEAPNEILDVRDSFDRSYEIEDVHIVLVLRLAQPAPELLEPDCSRGGGP
jgi:hypothetical protein